MPIQKIKTQQKCQVDSYRLSLASVIKNVFSCLRNTDSDSRQTVSHDRTADSETAVIRCWSYDNDYWL